MNRNGIFPFEPPGVFCAVVYISEGVLTTQQQNANSRETVPYYISLINGKYNCKTGKRGIVMSRTIYLVTGAAGFLGSHVCDELLDRGEHVRALVLPGDKSVKYVPKEVEIVEGDLCDVKSLDLFLLFRRDANPLSFTVPAW